MLFNSYAFIFLFLPLTLFVFFRISRSSHRLAALWLAAASLFFYGWWNPKFALLLLASIAGNYAAGYVIGHARARQVAIANRRRILTLAIATNLLLLAYFKYANFFISTVTEVIGGHAPMINVVLPLGISFFTFTQIAFLVDVHRGCAREYNLIHYLLFVTYFPHLIAGPVLHHKQMMPQFGFSRTYRPNVGNIALGLSVFAIGLFKKVILADQFALYANPVFDAVGGGAQPQLFEAWCGALAYTLQLYFDFSGYSDMAIGLSRMFNVVLPINFNSPYKAESIIDFWRRWHITLSTFLRDYLYIPLGGNRRGPVRRYGNMMTTMLLGGLWHGANWTFVLWGGLHGVYLIINHAWIGLSTYLRLPDVPGARLLSRLLTFLAVVMAWVPFRANSIATAERMLSAMVGKNGISLPERLEPLIGPLLGGSVSFGGLAPLAALPQRDLAIWLVTGLSVVWLLPNAQQWIGESARTGTIAGSARLLTWRPHVGWGVVVGMLLGVSLLGLTRESQFLYFQF